MAVEVYLKWRMQYIFFGRGRVKTKRKQTIYYFLDADHADLADFIH